MDIIDTEKALLSLLTGQFTNLTIEYNSHSVDYMSAQKAIERGEYDGDWVSEEEKLQAILKNSVWRMQWYPRTPVSCYIVCASSLEACMVYALTLDK